MYKLKYYAFLLLIFIIGCQLKHIPDDVNRILNLSGENKKELTKAIRHFQKSNDSLKLKALYFLISNMDINYSYYGEELDKFEPFFNEVGEIKELTEGTALWDEYLKKHGDLNLSKLKLKYDYEVVTAKFLIANIEDAFKAWKNAPWYNKISFDVFCEHILPYRSEDEHLENNWRQELNDYYNWIVDSIQQGISLQEAYSLIHTDIYKWGIKDFWGYPIALNLKKIMKIKRGKCSDEANMYVYACRALGIPAAFDLNPSWANRLLSHQWNSMVDGQGNTYTIYLEETEAKQFNTVDASVFYLDEPGAINLPDKIDVTTVKTVSKVFRRMFSKQKESLACINNGKEPIPPLFRDKRLIDVTDKYFECSDVTVDLSNFRTINRFAYLCVFNNFNWAAHSWGEIKEGKAIFKNMGLNIIYLPVLFNGKGYIPVSQPFLLDTLKNVKPIHVNENKLQNMVITRKYPLWGNILNYANDMIGGKFQGANSADFIDAIDLYIVKKTPYYINEYNLNNNSPYKYYRYISTDSGFGDIAEIEWLAKTGNEYIKYEGENIGKEGITGHDVSKAFDNNYDSFYNSKEKPGWAGTAFSKGVVVSRVKICPRNDTNIIFPGLIYELFYWNNGWKSLGVQEATEYRLIYKNVPTNGIYWLHCHSGGKEERIFTYENGRQVWW